MEEADIGLRNATYAAFVASGRAPTATEMAAAEGRSLHEVEEAWRRLHDAHALVLHDDGSIRMANPFSAVPTPYEVTAAGRRWFANCAWDAVGVCAALHVDGRIETTCAHCGEAISLEINGEQPDDNSLLFHCLVPASIWWDDIAFT